MPTTETTTSRPERLVRLASFLADNGLDTVPVTDSTGWDRGAVLSFHPRDAETTIAVLRALGRTGWDTKNMQAGWVTRPDKALGYASVTVHLPLIETRRVVPTEVAELLS